MRREQRIAQLSNSWSEMSHSRAILSPRPRRKRRQTVSVIPIRRIEPNVATGVAVFGCMRWSGRCWQTVEGRIVAEARWLATIDALPKERHPRTSHETEFLPDSMLANILKSPI
jgi:hypothetical protein